MTRVVWMYFPPEGSPLTLGEWNKGDGWDGSLLHMSDSLGVAQQWARELRDGRIPSAAAANGQAPASPWMTGRGPRG